MQNIKKTKVSYVSIMVFVMLAVCLFTSLKWSANNLRARVNDQLDASCYHDAEIIYPYGFSDADLDEIRKIDGIEAAEGSVAWFQRFKLEGVTYQAKIIALTETTDQLYDLEGELPSKAGEAVVKKEWAKSHGVEIGDTVIFKNDDKDGSAKLLSAVLERDTDALKELEPDTDGSSRLVTNTFTVTGLAESPAYINRIPFTFGVSTADSTAIDTLFFVSPESFDIGVYTGYTNLLIRDESMRATPFYADDFDEKADALKQKLDPVLAEITERKNKRIRENADSMLEELQRQIDDGEKELADGEKKTADGEIAIADGEKELADSKKKLADGQREVDDGYKQLAEAEKKLKDAAETIAAEQKKIDDTEKLLSEAKKIIAYVEEKLAKGEDIIGFLRPVLDALRIDSDTAFELAKEMISGPLKDGLDMLRIASILEPDLGELYELYSAFYEKVLAYENPFPTFEIDLSVIADKLEQIAAEPNKYLSILKEKLAPYEAELQSGKEALEQGKRDYASGLREYEDAKKQLRDYSRQIEEGKQKIKDSEKLLKDKSAELEQGRTDIENGRAELSDAKAKLEDARKISENISELGYSFVSRVQNGGTATALTIADVYFKIRYSMALLFVIVGMLVCYSAVSRIVYEQTVLIGTKSALGLKKKEITKGYMAYSLSSAFFGVIAGLLASRFVLCPVLQKAGASSLTLTIKSTYEFGLGDALIAAVVSILLIGAVTFFACRGTMRRTAIQMLSGPPSPLGKRRFFERASLWKKLPLFTKTVINNFLNDGKRIFASFVGIVGCTALVVCGFTFQYCIKNTLPVHFSDIQHFDTVIHIDQSRNENCLDEITAVLEKKGLRYDPVYSSVCNLQAANGIGAYSYIFASDSDDFNGLFIPITPEGEKTSMKGGVLISAPFAKANNVTPEDEYKIVTADGQAHTVKFDGSYKYYLMRSQLIMTLDTYEEQFGARPSENAVLVEKGGVGISELEGMLEPIEGFTAVNDYYSSSELSFKSFASVLDIMAYSYLALSVVMAMLVTLNLQMMCVQEKKRQLLTLRINGFSVKKTNRYFYSDTIAVSVVGELVGIAFGTVCAFLTLNTAASSSADFVRMFSWNAAILGIVICSVLTALTCRIAIRRIKGFKMTQINEP